jgi:hypothetical protein
VLEHSLRLHESLGNHDIQRAVFTIPMMLVFADQRATTIEKATAQEPCRPNTSAGG